MQRDRPAAGVPAIPYVAEELAGPGAASGECDPPNAAADVQYRRSAARHAPTHIDLVPIYVRLRSEGAAGGLPKLGVEPALRHPSFRAVTPSST
jgi:hypothetical protein